MEGKLKDNSMNAEELFKQGINFCNLERYEEALKAFEKAIEINPQFVEAWNGKGIALYNRERYKEALKAFNKAIKIDPQFAEAQYSKGVAFGGRGEYKKARRAYERTVKINPQFVEAWYNKGFALYKLRKYEEALKAFEKAIEINPQLADAWNGKGIALYNLGGYKEALRAHEKAIEINPKDTSPYANANLGNLFLNLGDLENASENVKTALAINDKFTSALRLKGRIEIEEKNYDGAIKSFEEAIRSDLGNPLLLLWTAYAKYLKIESSFDPGDRKYQEEIFAIIRELERANEVSKKHGEKGVRAYILYFLGCFYHKSRDVFSAKERLKECVSLKSKSPVEPRARELLHNIWNYAIRPPWWRWWWKSPLNCWLKRIGLAFLLFSIFSLLLLHPFIPEWLPVNWSIYIILIAFLIFLLLSPSIERIKIKPIEVELRSPPSFEPAFSSASMVAELKGLEAHLKTPKEKQKLWTTILNLLGYRK